MMLPKHFTPTLFTLTLTGYDVTSPERARESYITQGKDLYALQCGMGIGHFWICVCKTAQE